MHTNFYGIAQGAAGGDYCLRKGQDGVTRLIFSFKTHYLYTANNLAIEEDRKRVAEDIKSRLKSLLGWD